MKTYACAVVTTGVIAMIKIVALMSSLSRYKSLKLLSAKDTKLISLRNVSST